MAAGCEAIACDVRVLASQECHQCRAPLGDLRPPERDELSRLTIIEPQDSQLVLQESRLLAGLDDETLILGKRLGSVPLPEQRRIVPPSRVDQVPIRVRSHAPRRRPIRPLLRLRVGVREPPIEAQLNRHISDRLRVKIQHRLIGFLLITLIGFLLTKAAGRQRYERTDLTGQSKRTTPTHHTNRDLSQASHEYMDPFILLERQSNARTGTRSRP